MKLFVSPTPTDTVEDFLDRTLYGQGKNKRIAELENLVGELETDNAHSLIKWKQAMHLEEENKLLTEQLAGLQRKYDDLFEELKKTDEFGTLKRMDAIL